MTLVGLLLNLLRATDAQEGNPNGLRSPGGGEAKAVLFAGSRTDLKQTGTARLRP